MADKGHAVKFAEDGEDLKAAGTCDTSFSPELNWPGLPKNRIHRKKSYLFGCCSPTASPPVVNKAFKTSDYSVLLEIEAVAEHIRTFF
ncbi:MAG TPA: hypothetical protein VE868_10185 [Balneolaceae bacterium]|nr:hypothetical protein [Balneolaceae bacterium]